VYAGTRAEVNIADERGIPLTLDVTNDEQIEQAVREVAVSICLSTTLASHPRTI
jgi:hypothetical protein